MTAPILYFVGSLNDIPPYIGTISFPRKEPADGPGGDVGALLTPCGGIFDINYEPQHQTWHRLSTDDEPLLWFGIDARATLTPDMIQRPDARTGHKVKLGDGQMWDIPVARLVSGHTGLPKRRAIVDGAITWKVEEEYQTLCQFADECWNAKQGGDIQITEADLDRYCGHALSVNYYLHYREAIALGLFTDKGLKGIVDALVDMPTIEMIMNAASKKNVTLES